MYTATRPRKMPMIISTPDRVVPNPMMVGIIKARMRVKIVRMVVRSTVGHLPGITAPQARHLRLSAMC